MASLENWFNTQFDGTPVMAILRGFSPERTVELAERAWDLGIRCVEVPIQSAQAINALALTVAAGAQRGLSVGAGTVTSTTHVAQAAGVGAAFTVSPGLDEVVAAASLAAGMAHLPGVATASDIQRAQNLGLTWVKAFPAATLGEDWFRAMQGPFPQLKIVATGGMNARNASAYLAAGASVVAVGSALEDSAQLDLLSLLLSPV
ncbi:2-dehydro-3-deoxyphosphogluconate aldolase [Cryobacterium melibiosiphilum]|uniref:2-dehydro-3-deoxyphosphogluconate aldolase n=1 Tax=Cryobacterium melibiosiphilum TaxID=995039 RepID=A0A3A5MJW1_9MICO|nr:bifunctional 4-hydroxy-2-oxoglutarate aldolase/2-dehydro-3-deoxy-phosphogluconate aldolase [Cryobacterium melibiosiphilum]RJT90450.1 2-dehydro-3-deoxyphosphogluconate aldolase [Cryobacterium melibiosiphilum]